MFTSYMAIMGVAMLVTGVVSSRIGPKRTLLSGLVLIIVFAAAGRLVEQRRSRRRVPGRLGPGQRALRGHRAGHHRDVGDRRHRPGHHLVRGVAGHRDRLRPPRRRAAGRAVVASAVLRCVDADGGRPRRHRVLPARDSAVRPSYVAGRPVPGPAAQATAAHRADGGLLQHRLLHDPGRRARSRCRARGSSRSAGSTSAGACCVAVTSVFVAPRVQRWVGTVPAVIGTLVLFMLDLATMAVFADHQARRDRRHRAVRRVHRHQQHPDHRGRDGGRPGRAPGGVRGVLLRPLLRRRDRPLRRSQALRAAAARARPRAVRLRCGHGRRSASRSMAHRVRRADARARGLARVSPADEAEAVLVGDLD